MDIIFQGKQSSNDITESLCGVLQLLKARYHIEQFCEVQVKITLLDGAGEEVELVDSDTGDVYRVFEVYRDTSELRLHRRHPPYVKLVVDNSESGKKKPRT